LAVTPRADAALQFIFPGTVTVTTIDETVDQERRIVLFLSVVLLLDCDNRGGQSTSSFLVLPLPYWSLVGTTGLAERAERAVTAARAAEVPLTQGWQAADGAATDDHLILLVDAKNAFNSGSKMAMLGTCGRA